MMKHRSGNCIRPSDATNPEQSFRFAPARIALVEREARPTESTETAAARSSRNAGPLHLRHSSAAVTKSARRYDSDCRASPVSSPTPIRPVAWWSTRRFLGQLVVAVEGYEGTDALPAVDHQFL